jgi:iron complex outermembrane receptor protein
MHFVCTKKVRGTILDNNNQPIPGATINVPEIHKETISDAREISNFNLPSGKFQIVFSYIGYESQNQF